MRKIAFIAVIVFLAACLLPAGSALGKDETTKVDGFRFYEIKRGETLSEISWVLNIPMRKLVQWNPEVMDQGIRNLEPGTVLKYKLPEQIYKEVKQGQEQTREQLAKLRNSLKEKNEEFLESTKEVAKGEGQQTRQVIRETDRDQIRSLGRIEGKMDKLFGIRGDIYSLTLAIGIFVILLAAAVATFYFLAFRNKPQPQKSSETKDQKKEVFDQDKLNELEKVKLTPGSEQEVEFALNGHKFKVLLHHDGSKYHSWQREDGSAEFKKFGRKRDVIKSIKQSLKHYLLGSAGDNNRIAEAIQKGKIKKI